MNKNNPHSLKQEFTEYARTCILSRRPSDKDNIVIGRSAADSYVSFVEVDKLFSYNPEKWKDINSIFDIDSSEKIKEIYLELINDSKFNEVDSQGTSQYFRSNAIKQYYCFLKAREVVLGKTATSSYLDNHSESTQKADNSAFQIIYYGAPGTGKSHRIKKQLEEMNEPKENIFRTTFHPDSDYSSFVGCYKPTMKPVADEYKAIVGKDEEIAYSFVPQTFIKAYTQAYKNPDENIYLIIEEINRGNCAQIFGDLFQLLDRDENGVSEYPIKADSDLKIYLEGELGVGHDGIKDGELCLPSNLYIWATMNTSDQSLFPIDSAFKRRWDWEYEPIKYKNTDWGIEIGDYKYSWTSFQRIINDKIFEATNSEDKMLGDYFVKPCNNVITEKQFINKVLFYLWNDVCKDGDGDIFRTEDNKDIKFSDLYNDNCIDTLQSMMEYLGVTLLAEDYEIANVEKGINKTAKNHNKEALISIQLPNNPIILTSESTQFDAFVKALRIIGIDRIIQILPSLKYHRLGCPVLSTQQDDKISNNDKGYSYYQESNLFIVKGCNPYTYIRILEDLSTLLNIDISLETK